MKPLLLIMALTAFLFTGFGCTPVLDRDILREGTSNFSIARLTAEPDAFKGKLFILGGVVIRTRFTSEGSQIEALYVPVDWYGRPKDIDNPQQRFLAMYPRTRGYLDPVVFRNGKDITVAGTFLGIQTSQIDEIEYAYPVFEIKQVYLWGKKDNLYDFWPWYSYWQYYSYPFWWLDPWFVWWEPDTRSAWPPPPPPRN